jgi:hypothetical protein
MGFTATGIVLVFHQIPFSPLVMLVTHGAICKGKGRNYFDTLYHRPENFVHGEE